MEAAVTTTKQRRLWLAAVVISVFLVHTSSLDNDFVWLDHGDIEEQRAIYPLDRLRFAFVEPFGETGFYRPMVSVAHSIDAAVYGLSPFGFHATNLLLFVATVLAAVCFARYFFLLTTGEAAIAALIFGLHPLSALPAGAISYRPELFAALFTFLAVSMHIRTRSGPVRIVNRIITWVLIFCALFSKESALFWVPALILVWELSRWRSQADDGTEGVHSAAQQSVARWRPARLLFIGECAAIAIYLYLRQIAVPEVWHATGSFLDWSQALGTRLSALGMRLVELISPLAPSLSDATRLQPLLSPACVLTVTAIVVLGYLVYRARSDVRIVRLGWFFAIALAPALNLIPLPRFSSPHYGYLASLAVGVLAVVVWQRLQAMRPALRIMSVAAGVLWLLIAGFNTFRFGFRFENDRTLFAPEVAADPHFLEGHAYLGQYWMEQQQWLQAKEALEAALREPLGIIAYVDRGSAQVNLAGVMIRLGDLSRADSLLHAMSGRVSPGDQLFVDYYMALIALQQGNFSRVIELLVPYQDSWQRGEPLLLLAKALQHLNRTEEAISVLEKALPLLDAERRAKVRTFLQSVRKR